MAIAVRLPSNQRNYDEYWSGDPAFVQPPDPIDREDKTATAEDRAKNEKAREDHRAKVALARETGNWSELLAGTDQPTKFVLRPLSGDMFRKLVDLVSSDQIGSAEMNALAFRCALLEVSNLSEHRVKLVNTAQFGKIASPDIANVLDAVDLSIITELAAAIVDRAKGLSGKS